MKALVFTIALAGAVAVTGAAYAGGGCLSSQKHEQTAEAPPPKPPVPAPSS